MKRHVVLGLLLGAVALSGCGPQIHRPAPLPTAETLRTIATNAPPAVPAADATTAPTHAPHLITSTPDKPPPSAQPTSEPRDAAQRFLTALQVDRSGRLAALYASGVLAEQLRSGAQDLAWTIGDHHSFTSYNILAEISPFAYVQATLFYDEPDLSSTTRTLTLQQEDGFWSVIEMSFLKARLSRLRC